MTFCLGMRCTDGLLAIGDTRITSGTEMSSARKITIHQYDQHSVFIMTSGLRSIRDKAITYFEERLKNEQGLDRMYKAANALSEEIRRVRLEDIDWLQQGGLNFDLHCIFGGQLSGDDTHHMYLIYPEGNWVEVRSGTPYVIIGESRYGKPVLDRTWSYDRGLDDALRIGLLAFDATHTSASDVDYPVDVVMYQAGSFELQEQRLTGEDMAPLSQFWQAAIQRAVDESAPTTRDLFERIEQSPPAETRYGDNGH